MNLREKIDISVWRSTNLSLCDILNDNIAIGCRYNVIKYPNELSIFIRDSVWISVHNPVWKPIQGSIQNQLFKKLNSYDFRRKN